MIMYEKRSAFTMIEIMIVVFIIGLLSTILGPSLMKWVGKGEVSTTTANIGAIKSSLGEFRMDVGRNPTTAEGLDVLISPPKDKAVQARWHGPYIPGVEAVPMDAWGRPFIYNNPPVKFKGGKYQKYEIFSYGTGGEEGAKESDIISAGE